MEDSLKKRYLMRLFANFVNTIVAVVMIGIIPNALGSIAYGNFIFLQTFFMKIITFFAMSSPMALFTKISAKNNRKDLILYYMYFSIILFFILIFFIYMGYYTNTNKYFFPSIPEKYIFMGLIFSYLTWLTTIFTKISDAYAITTSVELTRVLYKVISIFTLYLIVYMTSFGLTEYYYFLFLFLILYLLTILYILIAKNVLTNSFYSYTVDFVKISKEFFDYINPLIIYNTLGMLVVLFDIWLLQKISGSEQVGYYGLSYSIVAICFLFTSSMTSIITREFSKKYGENNLKEVQYLFMRYIPMLYSIAAFFGIFISFQSSSILSIFTNEQFSDASIVLMVMGLFPIYQTYSQLIGSLFFATGQTKVIRNISYITNTVGVFVTLFLIYIVQLGAVGLALKVVMIEIVTVMIQLYFSVRFLKLEIRSLLFHQVYSILVFVSAAIISTSIVNVDSELISFLISGFIYTVFVIIFTYLFPQIFATTRKEIKIYSNKAIDVIKN